MRPRRMALLPRARPLRTAAALALLLLACGAEAAVEVAETAAAGGAPAVVVARQDGAQAALRIQFEVGAVDDGEDAGLTRLAQHALLHANERLDAADLLLGVFAAGGRLDLEISEHTCAFVLTAHRDDLLPLARRLAPALLAPRLAPRRFPAALARVKLEGGAEGDRAGDVGFLAALAVEDGRYRNEPAGTEFSLAGIEPRDVAAHVGRFFVPANATVVATCDVDAAAVRSVVAPFRGGRAHVREAPFVRLPFTWKGQASREVHLLAHVLALRDAQDAAAARVLAAVVEGRLWRRFRDAGQAYAFGAFVARPGWRDLLVVTLPSRTHATTVEPALRSELAAIAEGRLEDGELERARGAALGAFAREERDAAVLAAALAEGGAAWHGPAVEAALRTVDAAAFRARVAPWLDRARSMYLALGPTR
jgi:predicted Zn-dependent peptidase